MSTIAPPPMRPPNSGGDILGHNLDDVRDKFWTAALGVLEANSASLSYNCLGSFRSFISEGSTRFLEASFDKQNLTSAIQNLHYLVEDMVATASSRRMLAASAGGAQPMLIIDEEDFRITLQKARGKGWSFWPFN